MAPSGSIELRRPNTLIRKIPYRRIPRWITVVEVPRKYLSIVYRGKEINQVLAKRGLSINRI